MDYEEKYKSALKWMQSLYGGLHGATKEDAEKYFPELKESEDDKIREKIMNLVKKSNEQGGYALQKWEADDMLAWLEKQGEQKTDDKVEPKFKVGDWIILPLGIIAHIDSLNSTDYQVTTTDGKICDFKISKQDNYRLWSITDAKDGDVLTSELSGSIFLFRGIKDNKIDFYCDYDTYLEWPDDRFGINDSSEHYGSVEESQDIHPATKEQRELLFEKMKEAGYEWNNDKKELEKIESKTLDADKVIEWIERNASMFWESPCNPSRIVEQFKKDFGL